MADYIERTEEIMLAMCAGARAIENTKRYHGALYTKDVFSEESQEIPYLQAAKVLREASDAPAADVEPVRHGEWARTDDDWNSLSTFQCSACGEERCFEIDEDMPTLNYNYRPNCGAKMDGGVGSEL